MRACNTIGKMLSEYHDKALDEKKTALVSEHLSSCRHCRETLAGIEGLSIQFQCAPTVKAPSGFTHRLHQKMAPAPWWNKIFTTLFVPFKVKLPLELATATAVAVMAFFIFTVQEKDPRLMESVPLKREPAKTLEYGKAPSIMERATKKDEALRTRSRQAKEGLTVEKEQLDAEKASPVKKKEIRPAESKPVADEDKPHRLLPQNTAAAPSSFLQEAAAPEKIVAGSADAMTREKPIELVLFSDASAVSSDTFETAGRKPQPGRPSSGIVGAMSKKTEALTQDVPRTDTVSLVQKAVAGVGGKVLYTEQNADNQTVLLQIEIPHSAYDDFCSRLSTYGVLRKPVPDLGSRPPGQVAIQLFVK